MFEKPILNLVKFDMKDICTASNPGDEPAPAEPTTTFNCGTDTGFIGNGSMIPLGLGSSQALSMCFPGQVPVLIRY